MADKTGEVQGVNNISRQLQIMTLLARQISAIAVARALLRSLKQTHPYSPLTSRLENSIASADQILSDPHLTPEEKTTRIARAIETIAKEIENNQSNLTPEQIALIKKFKEQTQGQNKEDPFATPAPGAAAPPSNGTAAPNQESRPTTPAGQERAAPRANSAAHDSIVRGRVLNEPAAPGTHLELQFLKGEKILSFGRVIELFEAGFASEAGRKVTLETLMRLVSETLLFKTETSSRVPEMLLRMVLSSLTERLLKEIVREAEKTGRIAQREILKAVDRVNDRSVRLPIDIEVKDHPELRRERNEALEDIRAREESSATEKKSTGSERITYRVVYDRNGNVARIEVEGKLKEAEIVDALKGLVLARPAETIPHLVEAASRLLTEFKENRPEIARIVSEIVKLVYDRGRSASPRTDRTTVPRVAETVPRLLESAAREIERTSENRAEITTFVAETIGKLFGTSETTVLRDIIRILTTESRTATENAVRYEVAQKVAEQAPQAGLPVLLKAYARASATGNTTVRQALEPIILEAARSEAGVKYVLSATSSSAKNPLTSNPDISTKIYNQTAETVRARATATSATATTAAPAAAAKPAADQMLIVSRMVAESSPKATGQQFLETVTRVERALKAAGVKKLKTPKQLRAQLRAERRAVPYAKAGRATVGAPRPLRKAVPAAKIITAREALRELQKVTDSGKIAIPKELVQNICLGLVSAGLVPKNIFAGSFAAPQETASSSLLKRMVAALTASLEGQVNRAAQTTAVQSRVPAGAKPSKPILTPLEELYGMVAKLVGLNWEKIDAIMDLLKERGKRWELLRLLKRNQREEAHALLNEELSLASNPDLFVLAAA